jgi:Alr-MurF fusion protein
MNGEGFTIGDFVKSCKGVISENIDDSIVIRHLLIDSRKLTNIEGCLFFALVTRRNDGHKYITDLYQKGVRLFVVNHIPEHLELTEDVIFIVVKDTLKALQQLCSMHRKQFSIPVIGITGSNGKTIVKEWLAQLLGDDKNIIRSPKSYNSQVGVPLSVWQMNSNHELAIFEAGISEPDEMDKLQAMIQPTIGIFTNIGPAHDENFIHRDQKIAEKLKLFTKAEHFIYCSDHLEIKEKILKSELLRSIPEFTWGRKNGATLHLKNTEIQGKKTVLQAVFKEEEIIITIPFIDDASVENAMFCWSTMLLLGYQNEVISERMSHLTPVAMRLELKEGINNCSIINDSYSSDIHSLSIALDFLNQQKQHPKRTVILSDILQSGRDENDLYQEVADLLTQKKINRIIGIGSSISRQIEKFKMEKEFYPSTDDFLRDFYLSGFSKETILLKGARVFAFEKISKALQQKAHETVLEINLNALIGNLNYFRSKLQPDVKMMAMVKAFSYGSGSFEIANALQFHQVDYLTVAYADEGVELRKAGITMPIMVMNPEEQSFDAILRYNLEPEIYSFRVLSILEKELLRTKPSQVKTINIHIKLDTGMHRLGFEENQIETLCEHLKENHSIIVKSVFSHLAGSDSIALDYFTREQSDALVRMAEKIENEVGYKPIRHILNSAGISRFPDKQFEMVRLGIGLYGIGWNESEQRFLQQVSSLKTVISQIKVIPKDDTIGYSRRWLASKEMTIGIIPIGYADGLSRKLSNGKGKVLINGAFAPIVGNICMDMCMVDITDIQAKENDEVVIFGEGYSITDLANDMDTIPYEVLTGISRRVKRIYYQE